LKKVEIVAYEVNIFSFLSVTPPFFAGTKKAGVPGKKYLGFRTSNLLEE
jgi:hypothetical protein